MYKNLNKPISQKNKFQMIYKDFLKEKIQGFGANF